MLKLYESGLPAWSVFLPSYGLPYRPWMRRAAWMLYVAISFVSMACGFFDLYKNVPYVKQFVSSAMARVHLPAAALFEWLELHTQLRLSILLTWLFGRSPLFTAAMRALRATAGLAGELLAPFAEAVWAPLVATSATLFAPLVQAFSTAASVLQPFAQSCASAALATWSALCMAGSSTGHAVLSVLGPPLQLLISMFSVLGQLLGTAAGVLQALLSGPALVISTAWAFFAAMCSGAIANLRPLGQIIQ